MYKKKVRFTATLTGLLMTGFLVTSLISYNVAKNSLTRTILGETLPLTSDNIYSGVMQDLLRPITIASTMSGNTFVRTWLETGEQPIQAITDYLAGIEQRFGAVTAFLASERTRTYYDSSGLVRTFDPADPANVWYSHPDTSEPFNTVGHKAEISVDTDTTDRNRFDIVVSFPVWGSHGVFLGVSGVSLGLDSVRPLLADYEQRYDREIYLVDRQGQVQLHSSRLHSFDHLRDRSENEALVQAVLGDPTAQLQFRDPLGETVYLNSRLIPELDWFLIVEQVSRRDEATLLGTLIVNLLIALAVSAVVLLLVWATLGKYQRQLMTMATTDALTGTVSRQAFDELFEHATSIISSRSMTASATRLVMRS